MIDNLWNLILGYLYLLFQGCFQEIMLQTFYLTHLYPKKMALYGDMGNILAIKYRLKKMGWQVVYQPVEMGQELPEQTDFYFLGGGQDKEQLLIFDDLLTKKNRLYHDLQAGVAMLAICGGYQLLGQSFLTGNKEMIQGLGILPIRTVAPDAKVKSRCVGNIVLKCLIPEIANTQLIGFENHSGRTHFINDFSQNSSSAKPQTLSQYSSHSSLRSAKIPKLESQTAKETEIAQPLGLVLAGFGDNTDQIHEGCVWRNVVGTYLHGPCLAKNPQLANWLLARAIQTKKNHYKNKLEMPNFTLIDDSIAEMARQNILKQMTFSS